MTHGWSIEIADIRALVLLPFICCGLHLLHRYLPQIRVAAQRASDPEQSGGFGCQRGCGIPLLLAGRQISLSLLSIGSVGMTGDSGRALEQLIEHGGTSVGNCGRPPKEINPYVLSRFKMRKIPRVLS
jgi:hypothetical protein